MHALKTTGDTISRMLFNAMPSGFQFSAEHGIHDVEPAQPRLTENAEERGSPPLKDDVSTAPRLLAGSKPKAPDRRSRSHAISWPLRA